MDCDCEIRKSDMAPVEPLHDSSHDESPSNQLLVNDFENNVDLLELQNQNGDTSEEDLNDIPSRKRAKLDLCSVTSVSQEAVVQSEDCSTGNMSCAITGVADMTDQPCKLYGADRKHEMLKTKLSYREHLTEMFFLQNGGNLVDYFTWKKRPNTLLACYLRSEDCDTDAIALQTECDDGLTVFNGDCCGPNSPALTPNMRHPDECLTNSRFIHGPSSCDSSAAGDRSFCDVLLPSCSVATTTEDAFTESHSILSPEQTMRHWCTSSPALSTLAGPSSAASRLSHSFSTDSFVPNIPGIYGPGMLDGFANESRNQETIAELARQEAEVMEKIAELRKRGMWSVRRMARASEPAQPKVHWDYVLEEMQWLSSDFAQERKWKRAGTRKVARLVTRHFQERQQQEQRAEREDSLKLKRIASNIAKCVKEFWSNIEKVVQYKQQSRLGEKRKKALDLHLSFIVDQTEKYSSWLTEGLGQATQAQSSAPPSVTGPSSVCGSAAQSDVADDDEFDPNVSSTDDEETIEKEEQEKAEDDDDELDKLRQESEMPIEELLAKFSAGVGDWSSNVVTKGEANSALKSPSSDGTVLTALPRSARLRERSLRKSSQTELNAATSSEQNSNITAVKQDADDDTDIEDEADVKEELLGTEFLITDLGISQSGSDISQTVNDENRNIVVENKSAAVATSNGEDCGPGRQMQDIAATAMSIQPTGYTLETAHVKTQVPFLIKHQLREYQHVGLDWLATMYEQRLNGILADEMGLGKTIQTIALLAYLACEKGIWGPHLIVVPTSVMLNWEMECKKWCPALKILTYYGSIKERRAKRQGWTKTNAFHVCITSYKLVIQDHQAFRRKKWKYFILDEAQNIKNFKSQRWQTLLNFHSQRRLLLTGTPLQNNLMELWSLMHFLMPHVFQSHREFKEWFSNPLTGMVEGSREYNEQLVRRLHKVLRPFLLRRLKVDVEKQMPKKYEHVIMCRLSKRQRFLYDDFMGQAKTKESLSTGHFMSVINILMQLRKVCNHPSLFDPRPTVSSFHMDRISYHVPSIIVDLAERNASSSDDNDDVVKQFILRSSVCDLEAMSSLAISRISELAIDFRPLIVSLQDDDYDDEPYDNTDESSDLPDDLKALLHIDALDIKRKQNRIERMERLCRLNASRCSVEPVYGCDIRRLLNCVSSLAAVHTSNCWLRDGYINCLNIVLRDDVSVQSWSDDEIVPLSSRRLAVNTSTNNLRAAVRTQDEQLESLSDVIERFVFVIPPATAPRIMLHQSHPYPSAVVCQNVQEVVLQSRIAPHAAKLHVINNNRAVQFPDLRLIQYDCGKLQTMDILLRRLKSGGHRVLVFTQMTRVLDILESFLNFHGHRYVRLDGTTKIEQRQALMERFNVDTRIFVFILSTRSGGIGVNLTGADTVIFYDSDWNPTMDAQAQDRCHRIGQTRDVNIYRLVSEKTVEENILKKANEKRLLGNVAIEGGNFTTAFFRQGAITDLFAEPTGLDNLKDVKSSSAIASSTSYNKEESTVLLKPSLPTTSTSVIDQPVVNQELIEQALCAAEDESDIRAAEVARAEQKAELAEFDETIPWDGQEGEGRGGEADDQSKAELELALLEKELMPVERYAVQYVEQQMAPLCIGELQRADEEVDIAKEEWELNHLKALKEEEERRAELEEDEMLYTSSHRDLSSHYKMRLEEEYNNSRQLLLGNDTVPMEEEEEEDEDVDVYDNQPIPARRGRPPKNSIKNLKTFKTKKSVVSRDAIKQSPREKLKQKLAKKLEKKLAKRLARQAVTASNKHHSKHRPIDEDEDWEEAAIRRSQKKLKQPNNEALVAKVKAAIKRSLEPADVVTYDERDELEVGASICGGDVEEEEVDTSYDVPILKPKRPMLHNLKKSVNGPTTNDNDEQRVSHSPQVIAFLQSASKFRQPVRVAQIPNRMPFPQNVPQAISSSAAGSPQTVHIRYQFENRPTPILEKLSANVLSRNDGNAAINSQQHAVTARGITQMHTSRLSQIVSSISQSFAERLPAGDTVIRLGSPNSNGEIQYVLTRQSNSVSPARTTLNFNNIVIGGAACNVGPPASHQNLIFVPHSASSAARPVPGQVIVQAPQQRQAVPAGRQNILILPSAATSSASSRQNFFVAQGADGVRQFFLLPRGSVATSQQQSFVITPRMMTTMVPRQTQQVLLSQQPSAPVSSPGSIVLPSGATISLAPRQQQLPAGVRQFVLAQAPSTLQSQQQCFIRPISSSLSLTRAISTSNTANTVPILEKLAKQLIPSAVTQPAPTASQTAIGMARLSSVLSGRDPNLSSIRTEFKFIPRGGGNSPISINLIPSGGQMNMAVGPAAIQRIPIPVPVQQQRLVIGAQGVMSASVPQLMQRAQRPASQQPRIILIDSPITDPSIPKTATTPDKQPCNRTA